MEQKEEQIIASVDGSVGSLAVCEAAAWVASRLDRSLLLLHTLERRQQHGADDWSGAIGLGAQSELLERMAQLDQERGRLAMQYGKTLLTEAESRQGSLATSPQDNRIDDSLKSAKNSRSVRKG